MGARILSKDFSASIEIIIWFLSFNSLIWCITLIDLHILKNLAFWCVAEFCLLKFCWGFLHLCSSVILACSFLFCVVFVWFWYQGNGGLTEWIWECSFVFVFFEFFFEKDRYKFLFICLVEFPNEAIWSWSLVCRDFYYFRFYLF